MNLKVPGQRSQGLDLGKPGLGLGKEGLTNFQTFVFHPRCEAVGQVLIIAKLLKGSWDFNCLFYLSFVALETGSDKCFEWQSGPFSSGTSCPCPCLFSGVNKQDLKS